MDRREFLRLAGTAAAVAAVGGSCGSASEEPEATAATRGSGPGGGERTLRIAQWSHYVPAHDAWFDNEFVRRWGEDHDVQVLVDHINIAEVPDRAAADVASNGPHDIFGFVAPPPSFEDHVIDHREIVEEVSAKLGPMTALAERSIFNPKTRKYFGFSQYWAADPVNYRADLWDRVQPGLIPDTWENVLLGGRKLKSSGNPIGISMAQEYDGNVGLMALTHSFGASVQNEEAIVTINRPATVEAVKAGAAIYKAGMTEEVFAWDPASNNRLLASGSGSMILNAVSALRAVEGQRPELADSIRLAPTPAGPAARLGPYHVASVYVIWEFSKNQDLAKQFLVDLALRSRDAFVHSGFYNIPSFPKAVPDLDALVGGKYSVLSGAVQWSVNTGHPGHSNAAIDEVSNRFLIPKMFAAVARGELSAEEAVERAHAEAEPIFARWRERGKI